MTSAHNQSASTRRSKYFGPPLAEQEENNNRSKPKYFKPLTTFGTSVAAPVSQRSHKSEGHRLDVSGAGIEIAVTIEDDKEVSVVKSPLRNRQGPVSNHKRHVSQPVSHLICGTLESGGHSGRKSPAARRPNSALGDHPERQTENFRVAIRIRPPVSSDITPQPTSLVKLQEGRAVVYPPRSDPLEFPFEFCWQSLDSSQQFFGSQTDIYERLAKPVLLSSLQGINACLFAYGQTGTGKTHSVMGIKSDPGVLPRFCQDVFEALSEDIAQNSAIVKVSYYELYCERIRDLLSDMPVKSQPQFKIREDPVTGPYVAKLSCPEVRSFEDLQTYLELGQRQRTTATTMLNEHSSRSHAVFTLKITRKSTELVDGKQLQYEVTSVASVVDLAGSERAGTSASLTETSAINKSLSTLSKVIDELSKRDRQGKSHISYRDSVLTWLLKESLGGNSRTAMLATISPAVEHMSETLSTLRYASQARNIRNSVAANEDPSQVLIKKLRAEIDQLKADQKENSVGFSPYPAETQRELDELNRQLQTIVEEKDREMKELRAKIEAASEEKLAELKKKFRLYEYDIGTSDFPVLVLLSPDPMSIDAVSWQLTSKKIQVGTAENCDIRLSEAVRVTPHHCDLLSEADGSVWLQPVNGKTFLNGQEVVMKKQLHHGDRIILAAEFYFRLILPDQNSRFGTVVTFEAAKAELFESETQRLEEESIRQRNAFRQEAAQLREEIQRKSEAQEKLLIEAEEKTTRKLQIAIEEEKRAKSKVEAEEATNKRRSLTANLVATQHMMAENRINTEELVNELEAQVQPARLYHSRRTQLELQLNVEFCNEMLKRMKKEFEMSVEESANSFAVVVKNTKMNSYCVWSPETFEAKLPVIKDIYESRRDSKDDRLPKLLYTRDYQWSPCVGKGNQLLSYALVNAMKTAKRRSSAYRRSSISPFLSANTSGRMSMSAVDSGDVSTFLSTTLMGEIQAIPEDINPMDPEPNFFETMEKSWKPVEIPSCHQNGRYHRCLWFIRFLMDRCEVALEGFTGLVDWAEFLCNFLPAINELDQLVYCVSDEILSKGEDTHCAAKRLCSTMSSITAYSQVLVQASQQQSEGLRHDSFQHILDHLKLLVADFGPAIFCLIPRWPLSIVGKCRTCRVTSVISNTFVKSLQSAIKSVCEERIAQLSEIHYFNSSEVTESLKKTIDRVVDVLNCLVVEKANEATVQLVLNVVFPFAHLIQIEGDIVGVLAKRLLELRDMTESLWSDCIWKESQIEDVCVSFVSSMEQLIEVMKDWRSGQSSRHNSAVSRRIWRFEAIPYQLHEDLTKISFDDSVNV